MKRHLHALSDQSYDLLIIGGGINGLASAWDASLRGLKVALIEKGDFGGETSASSLRIIHGGLRYLQHLDMTRMKESIVERSAMMRIVPHLMDPFPFMIPTYGYAAKGKMAMSIAMKMNDYISRQRNGSLQADQYLPNGEVISREESLSYMPSLSADGLTGAAIFYDGRMHSADRVNLAFALSAAEQGANLANYVEAERILVRGGRTAGAVVHDVFTGEVFEIEAKTVLCMMGPWSGRVAQLTGQDVDAPHLFSAGFQIIAPEATRKGMGAGFPSRHVDPDARLNRGGRHYFTTPWRGMTVWGTTDSIHRGAPETWRITEEAIEQFILELNESLPDLNLERDQVVHAFGGLRPIDAENVGKGSTVSRKSELLDHSKDLGIEGLFSGEGVKFTTGRLLAQRSIDAIVESLGLSVRSCHTLHTLLIGGNFSSRSALAEESDFPEGASSEVKAYALRHYGSEVKALIELWKQSPSTMRCLSGSIEITEASVLYAVEEEQALRLSDVLLRRTDAGTLRAPSEALVDDVTGIMASLLHWDAGRCEYEKSLLWERYPIR